MSTKQSNYSKLSKHERLIAESVTNTLSSWVGEKLHNIQKSFEQQLEDATSKMKEHVMEYIDCKMKQYVCFRNGCHGGVIEDKYQ